MDFESEIEKSIQAAHQHIDRMAEFYIRNLHAKIDTAYWARARCDWDYYDKMVRVQWDGGRIHRKFERLFWDL